jgi:hypothetical protein
MIANIRFFIEKKEKLLELIRKSEEMRLFVLNISILYGIWFIVKETLTIMAETRLMIKLFIEWCLERTILAVFLSI